RQHLGEDELTLTALNNSGLLFRGQARYEEAEPMLREAFVTRRHTLGDSHPSTILSEASLGWLYVQMEKYDEAEKLLDDALQEAGDVFGTEHPRTLSYTSLLAGLYEVTQRQEKALELNRFILDVRTRTLGGDHPDTLSALNTLARQLVAMERLSQAEPLWVKVLESAERVHGPNHVSTLAAYHGLSGVRRKLGKPAEALELSTLAVERTREYLPKGHWYLGAFLTNHGQVLADLDRNDEAAVALEEAIEILQAAFGEDHARSKRVIRLASDLGLRNENKAKAEELSTLPVPKDEPPG
ncbi:MAG: tetratricopeptide repeat protein, partial [Dehalococcoidia bacterium]